MRPLEWLLLLSFLPALAFPHWAVVRERRGWLLGAALLPLLALLAHLVLEGWRTQLLPLYVLAVLLGGARLYTLCRRGVTARRPARLVTALIALVVIADGIVAGWLLPVVVLPAPTGPYPVGIVNREIVDASRSRRLMISIWYPAASVGPPAKLTAYPDTIAAGIARAYGLPLAAPALQQLRYIEVAASADAPIAATGGQFPVLLFSHGLTGVRLQNSTTMQELASWGYVVVALDHTDAAAVTVFPDSETRQFDLSRFGIGPADIERSTEILLPVWVADQRAVYDHLERWAVDDPLLASTLDLRRFGSFGHSFGGATALEVCRVEQRCQAAANIDGGVSGDRVATRPFLLLTATTSNLIPEAMHKWRRLVDDATAPAYWVELAKSNHFSFTILPLLSPLLAPSGTDTRAGLQTTDRYIRAFFDHHLLGAPAPLLDPASSAPDVRWHSR